MMSMPAGIASLPALVEAAGAADQAALLVQEQGAAVRAAKAGRLAGTAQRGPFDRLRVSGTGRPYVLRRMGGGVGAGRQRAPPPHPPRPRGPLLGVLNEAPARAAVVVQADGDVALLVAHAELV